MGADIFVREELHFEEIVVLFDRIEMGEETSGMQNIDWGNLCGETPERYKQVIREALDRLPEERCGFLGRILLSVKKRNKRKRINRY